MKIIDFHTHTFPDSIAEKTAAFLSDKSHTKAFLLPTAGELSKDNARAGISLSVVLPVVTNPLKTEKINLAAAKINESTKQTGVFSFGGVHPDTPNVKEEIKRISSLGLKGIKIHPAYQGVPLNDIRFMRIAEYAEEYGLILVTHGGIDIGIEGNFASPKMCLELLKSVRPTRLVMAHMGGWKQWQEAREYLAGQPVYFDTAFSFGEYSYEESVPACKREKPLSKEELLSLIRLHGADKILFGTDSPWTDRKEQVNLFSSLPFSEEEREKIFFQNAKNLLSSDFIEEIL